VYSDLQLMEAIRKWSSATRLWRDQLPLRFARFPVLVKQGKRIPTGLSLSAGSAWLIGYNAGAHHGSYLLRLDLHGLCTMGHAANAVDLPTDACDIFAGNALSMPILGSHCVAVITAQSQK
jgi:hypothetical protein